MTRVASIRGPYQKVGKSGPKPRKPIPRRSKKRQAYMQSQEYRDGLIHMGKVASLPCVICQSFGFIQYSRTEVHHLKSGRYSQRREDAKKTIPLCHGHHNSLDPNPGEKDYLGYHNGQETWEAEYGKDYEYLDVTLDAIERI